MEKNQKAQNIAKEAMSQTCQWVRAGQSLQEVRDYCEQVMRQLGAEGFWYYGIGAFIFSGEETVVSVSGRDYQTPERTIQNQDLLTIDLSPQYGGAWGDYARTLVIEDGKALPDPGRALRREWGEGVLAEQSLHQELRQVARPSMTFEELHAHMNERIHQLGYENLDLHGNLGHSIEQRPEDRIYIEEGNTAPLASAELFTFEPHIRRSGTTYGFKYENIYYFANGSLETL
ncbi:M24 family metallopeptidase [Nesterenkonia alkaliphila]|uniref:M24 family metallopeptidase n=1 Tax=Nesterenkonia alkaliphila TaxID=1463631 RepID=A0A7K1UFM4_9MICC|nr:M24 family metallopeptidase [Nesterenkonia alkaliphila]MVT25249.1 M24 family metallopeptidase [Nesterenkonia alkaliphila]GFZ91442.1 hypothetical protein GCM10011359_20970 [Nesterenkonia alkaliphila]